MAMHGRKKIKTFSCKNPKKDYLEDLGVDYCVIIKCILTHCGPVTQICVFTLQLCKTDEANLPF